MGKRGGDKRMGRPPTETIGEGERRSQIMRAALELFGTRGYAAVSIGDIAAAVGVTKAALYHHFSGKDELYTVVVSDLLIRIAAAIAEIGARDEPIETKIRLLIERPRRYLDRRLSMEAMMRDVREQLNAEQRERILAAHSQMDTALIEMMRAGVESGALRAADPRLVAHAFRRLLAGFADDDMLSANHAETETMIDLFLHGIVAVPSRSAESVTS